MEPHGTLSAGKPLDLQTGPVKIFLLEVEFSLSKRHGITWSFHAIAWHPKISPKFQNLQSAHHQQTLLQGKWIQWIYVKLWNLVVKSTCFSYIQFNILLYLKLSWILFSSVPFPENDSWASLARTLSSHSRSMFSASFLVGHVLVLFLGMRCRTNHRTAFAYLRSLGVT